MELSELKDKIITSFNGAEDDLNEILELVERDRPDITLTELMNKLAINGVRFMFDVNAKRGGSTVIPEVTEVKNEQESALNELTDLSQELKLY